jgi:putative DNA primase/helicase
VGSVKRFSELMAARKFEKCRLTGGARGITGIALRPKPYSHGYPTEMTEQSGRVTDLTGF